MEEEKEKYLNFFSSSKETYYHLKQDWVGEEHNMYSEIYMGDIDLTTYLKI